MDRGSDIIINDRKVFNSVALSGKENRTFFAEQLRAFVRWLLTMEGLGGGVVQAEVGTWSGGVGGASHR